MRACALDLGAGLHALRLGLGRGRVDERVFAGERGDGRLAGVSAALALDTRRLLHRRVFRRRSREAGGGWGGVELRTVRDARCEGKEGYSLDVDFLGGACGHLRGGGKRGSGVRGVIARVGRNVMVGVRVSASVGLTEPGIISLI